MAAPNEAKSEFTGADRALLCGFLLGPAAALTNLLVTYMLVPTACANRSALMLHVSAAAFFVIALCGVWLGRRVHDGNERMRWLATVVNVLSIGSALLILAMEIPNLILGSCS